MLQHCCARGGDPGWPPRVRPTTSLTWLTHPRAPLSRARAARCTAPATRPPSASNLQGARGVSSTPVAAVAATAASLSAAGAHSAPKVNVAEPPTPAEIFKKFEVRGLPGAQVAGVEQGRAGDWAGAHASALAPPFTTRSRPRPLSSVPHPRPADQAQQHPRAGAAGRRPEAHRHAALQGQADRPRAAGGAGGPGHVPRVRPAGAAPLQRLWHGEGAHVRAAAAAVGGSAMGWGRRRGAGAFGE
jgi:hypothetical protein